MISFSLLVFWLMGSAKVIKICTCTPIHSNLASNQKNANIENVIMDLVVKACNCEPRHEQTCF